MSSGRRLALGERGEIETTPQCRDAEGKWKRHATGRGKTVERWRARVYFRGHDGISSEASCVAPTKREAVAALEARLSERQSVGDVDLKSSTPFVKAGELWLARIARTDSGLSERTVLDYQRTFARYVDVQGSSLRGLTLEQANDPQKLRAFLETVADKRGTASAKITKSVLSGVLTLAVDSGVLTGNAMRQVRPVKSQSAGKDTPRDTSRSFTAEERAAVLAYADELAAATDVLPTTKRKREAVADLLAFMAGTGARVTEVRSLRWAEVDLVKGTAELHGTKSVAAVRRVTFPKWLADRMRARGERVGTDGLAFPAPHLTESQKPWDQSNAAKALAKTIKGAGMDWATPHAFRRTVATHLHEAGVPLVRIADQLGHADPAMTARVYLGRDFMGDHGDAAKHL